jgi:dTDP-4-amino-4,6-dideoxygalactose transaminase
MSMIQTQAALHAPPPVKFSLPVLVADELQYVREAMLGGHVHGDGPFTARCSAFLEQTLGCPKVLLTTSCTHALEMAGLLLNLSEGDEVIVPSFTFVSTATALVRAGARLVFVDVRRDTLNLNEDLLEAAITPRTRAIMLVHYAGVGCEMNQIMEIARKHNLPIIEDTAHGLFGKYEGKYLGTMGALGCLSFHGTKNFTCGEGGALLVNDPALIERAEIIREKGTNRRAFIDGRVDKYTWVDVGSSYLPSDVLAAFLLGQLESWEGVQERRRKLWLNYYNCLSPVLERRGVRLPLIPQQCEQAYHMFYLIARNPAERSGLLKFLRDRGIEASFHYQPLHSSQAGRKYGRSLDECPVTTEMASRLVRLPLHLGLDEETQFRVVDAVTDFYL